MKRVPGLAIAALAHPLRMRVAALRADESLFGLGH